MEPVQQDIRITKTHQALVRTLLELLEQKKFQKITVNDICQKAMVSRSTFYLHFEDKYQLLLFCMNLEREHLRETEQEKSPREFLRMMLETVKERKSVYRNLLLAEVDKELVGMFQSHFHDFFEQKLAEIESRGKQMPGPIPLLAAFYANGLSGMIVWWIEKNFPYSTEEMAACQYELLSPMLLEECD